MSKFKRSLEKAGTEEAVKAAFVKRFNLKFNNPMGMDLYVPPVMFEFKYKKDLSKVKVRAAILAQALYYVHKVRYNSTDIVPPKYVCLADHNQAVLLSCASCLDFVDGDYDWLRAPSSPDPALIEAICRRGVEAPVYELHKAEDEADFIERMEEALADCEVSIQRLITQKNFESVYLQWKEKVYPFVSVEVSPSWLFVQDVCMNTIMDEKSGKMFLEHTNETVQVSPLVYKEFWSGFVRPPDVDTQNTILSSVDRLSNMEKRRFTGQFFTPEPFAGLALEYLEKELGKDWQDEYYIYDPCCATGNLEVGLKNYNRVFMSTLDQDEVDYIKGNDLFPGATVFQFDFLNDPVSDLPKELQRVLKEEKVVVLMNPPYAEAGGGMTGTKHKPGVSKNTEVCGKMKHMGKARNELFAQFLYRTSILAPEAVVGMFSTVKYITAPSFKKLRSNMQGVIGNGFMFHCKAFHGTSGNWPVMFSVIRLGGEDKITEDVVVDMLDTKGNKIGKKELASPDKVINKWFKRPKGEVQSVPMTSALKVTENKVYCEKLSKDGMGYCCLHSNDLQQATLACLLSGTFSDGAGTSVASDNFEKVMMSLAVRKAIKPTWLNDRDQFSVPHTDPLPPEFVTDCTVFNLFSGHNQTSSFTADYKGKRFLENHFFPFPSSVCKTHGPVDLSFHRGITDDKFTAKWLESAPMSVEAREVMDKGMEVYKVFYKNWVNINHSKWKVENPYAGWYQVRKALSDIGKVKELKEVSEAVKKLKEKIIPQVYKFGFLPMEKIFDDAV